MYSPRWRLVGRVQDVPQKRGKDSTSSNDDLMSATRYGAMSMRFAVSGKDPTWTKDLGYKIMESFNG